MFKWSYKYDDEREKFSFQGIGTALLVGVTTSLSPLPVAAQSQEISVDDIEEIVVQGTRRTIQDSIQQKRNADVIVEALSAEDIGDIPALSIGEALETLTSAASHREQGGATEISIRGMGPYLGSTVINGREATNGSGDRSVNFSQFPSELFNTLQVYKSQEASLIEGGVSGQISLETIKPLDYGRQRVQLDLKGNYNPDNQDIKDNERDYGYRGTVSYIDQFDFGEGSLGISLGLQKNVATNPEQEYRTSSTYRSCRNDPDATSGVYASGNCDSNGGSLNTNVDPATGESPDDADTPVIFVPSSRSYRQNITDDDRESIFAAVQWQPNDKLDINVDYQYSDRVFTEIRNDLVFAENRRVNPEGLVTTNKGAVLAFNNDGRIETHSQFQERLEEYEGGGITVKYEVNDRLNISFDASYSDTSRRENIFQTRLQSEANDIFGNPTPAATDRPATSYRLAGSGSNSSVGLVTVTNFDVTNHDLFADAARTRIDLNQARDNTITAFRGDFELEVDWGPIHTLEGGMRYSELEFTSFPRVRDELNFNDNAIAPASLACRNESFPESGFLSEPSNGQALITNVDENGNVIAAGTGSRYATFDPMCLVQELIIAENAIRTADGRDDLLEFSGFPSPEKDVNNVDVEEDTIALYIQANYESELNGYPVRGNFGLRIVRTDVTSTGLRTTFTSRRNDDGNIIIDNDQDNFFSVEGGDSYTEFLPSASIVVDLRDDILLRGGIFRGLSRPDPADLGFGRRFEVDDNAVITDLDELVGEATATGNPDLEPLLSWNFDAAIEWYPNDDTILALGGYYKRFQGGFENVQRFETFIVDGEPLQGKVTTTRTDSDTSTLKGFELTATHSFSYLPSFWSGFGAKLSYNYADSDFEFEHGRFGAAEVRQVDGTVEERIGIVPPANLFGFSDNVLSTQLYYQWGGFDLQLIYKYRSEYFQQFISTPGELRYIGDTEVFEARLTYKLNDNVSFRIEGINLFDEDRTQFNPVDDNVAEVNSYGPRYFAGVRVKF
ncbi:TonB-dependent receptor [Exilibacterium tricleocarpae]|uniref:TonB-dependent receptor n=1 Tax=Exilibacterium tricleocarpae TaxID=2591008 RepID=A0A545TNE1_9GAMM|nr:TonB-dependent receptor [Exilibacterium tricleocarpae]TQV78739.1 TonB-dependent receptor [Exilibacterium tricleocarpae]